MAMHRDNDTDMGGVGKAFLTTHWSLIEETIAGEDDRNQALIDLLIAQYWKPVYCYLRRKAYGNEEAKDLTQGFFQEIVLGKKLIADADRTKGRFRSYLLTALNHYLINVRHRESAKRHIPKSKLLSMNTLGGSDIPKAVIALTPEDSFTYAWISTLLEDVIDEVKRYCDQSGKSVHWQVFRERTLRPIMEDREAPTIESVCESLGIAGSQKASNMIVTVKRRFQSILRQHLRKTVTSDQEANEELKEIKRFLPLMAE